MGFIYVYHEKYDKGNGMKEGSRRFSNTKEYSREEQLDPKA